MRGEYLPKLQSPNTGVTSRQVIVIAYAVVWLFCVGDVVLSEFPSIEWLVPAKIQAPWLISIGACTAVFLFVVQPESFRRSLGKAAVVLPLILAFGIVAGAYILRAGFNAKGGIFEQVAFCAVGTILLGEVWIVNESVSWVGGETRASTAAAS